MKKQTYGLSMQTVVRIVQILQEAIITGTDISDLLSDMRVMVSKEDKDKLDISPEYMERVEKWHEELIENAKAMGQENERGKII